MTVEKSDQDKHFTNSLTEQINEVMKSRKEMNDNSHLRETLRVLPVEAYRSAIGAIWNATVDDLRQKLLHQGIDHFHKKVKVDKSIKTYEDLQNLNDHTLLDGSRKVGIIDQEAYKMLVQVKDTRNTFSGHPGSSEPTLKKVLSVAEDCIKYVLSRGYPSPTIDINDYIKTLKSSTYDKNEVAVKNMVDGLSESSKILIHRLFEEYLRTDCKIFTGNIRFVLPFLWQKLSELEKGNVVGRLDKILVQGNTLQRDKAFSFIQIVDGKSYLSSESSAIIKFHINPTIQALKDNSQRNGYDECMKWGDQLSDVLKLKPFSAVIVGEHTADYVSSLISVFVGTMPPPYKKDAKRKDWVANGIDTHVLEMFRDFDDQMASIFIHVIKNDKILKDLVRNHPVKMEHLRNLAKIVDEKTSESFSGKELLKLLVDKTKEQEFLATLLDSRASDELE